MEGFICLIILELYLIELREFMKNEYNINNKSEVIVT